MIPRSKSSAKVIFEFADCAFCGVAAVGVRGTSWKSKLYLREAFCVVWEHLLSRMRRVGDEPCWIRCSWHVFQAIVISRAYRFLRRWAWMELVL